MGQESGGWGQAHLCRGRGRGSHPTVRGRQGKQQA